MIPPHLYCKLKIFKISEFSDTQFGPPPTLHVSEHINYVR